LTGLHDSIARVLTFLFRALISRVLLSVNAPLDSISRQISVGVMGCKKSKDDTVDLHFPKKSVKHFEVEGN